MRGSGINRRCRHGKTREDRRLKMENENNKNFPFGRKSAMETGAMSPGEMPEGILGAPKNVDPHGSPRDVTHSRTSMTSPNEPPPGLLPQSGVLNPSPHVYGVRGERERPAAYTPEQKRAVR
jgi:hypothetical protein